MRIVYCLPEISHPGGIGRITANKANYWVKTGNEVYIITTDQKGKIPYYQLDNKIQIVDLGINFIDSGSGIIKRFFFKLKKQKEYRLLLKQFLLKIRADIVVSTFTNEASFLYKIKDGSKKVLECHFCHDALNIQAKVFSFPFYLRIYNRIKTVYNTRIAEKYNALVLLTEEDRTYWKSMKNIYVIPNFLSFEVFEEAKLNSKNVIAVGRLDAQKDFFSLVSIWNLVRKRVPEWHLNIFGQGKDKDALDQYIKLLGLENYVTIHKPIHNIQDKYMESSIFVMTSNFEGFGLVLIEAMSCGLPVVSYGCPCGPKDIIDDGKNGYLIAGRNIEEFADKLVLLIQNEILRKQMGKEARKKSSRYNQNDIMKQWENLFKSLI